jgi:hypothetical protein
VTSPASIDLGATGSPLGHWAFYSAPAAGTPGAVRVRIYRPLKLISNGGVPDVTLRTSWIAEANGEHALLRELYQDGCRCIEEHWWPADAVPAGLIPARRSLSSELRFIRPGKLDLLAGKTAATGIPPDDQRTAASIGRLVAALSAALRDERRRVATVAACFLSAPTRPQDCIIRISGGAEGRLWLDVEDTRRCLLLLAAVWFGCGPR